MNTAVYWDFSGANATARRCKEKNKIAVYWLKWRCKETKSPGRCNSYFSGAKKYWFLSETRLFISFSGPGSWKYHGPKEIPGTQYNFSGTEKIFSRTHPDRLLLRLGRVFPKPGSIVVFYAFEGSISWPTIKTGLGNTTEMLFRAQNRVGWSPEIIIMKVYNRN